jgi:hypothetical protein
MIPDSGCYSDTPKKSASAELSLKIKVGLVMIVCVLIGGKRETRNHRDALKKARC